MQSLRARYFYDFRCVAYRVYNNYAHATRLIESFFLSSPAVAVHSLVDRITRHLEYLFVHSIRLCTDGVCVRALVCVKKEIRFSVERNNTVEQSANDGEERGGGLSSPCLSVFLSSSRAYVWALHDERCTARGEWDARGENFLLWTSSDATSASAS